MAVQELRFVETNPELLFCFDNVLDANDLQYINNYNWDSLEWTASKIANYRKTYNFKDSDNFLLLNVLREKAFACFKTIDPDAELTRVLTFAFGLSEHDGKMFRHPAHPDILETGGQWTLLFHLTGNSGPTDFYNNSVNNKLIKSFDYCPGRLIIFPAIYQHQGSMPDAGSRLIVNVRAVIDTKLNADILKCSPALAKRYQQDYISASYDSLL